VRVEHRAEGWLETGSPEKNVCFGVPRTSLYRRDEKEHPDPIEEMEEDHE